MRKEKELSSIVLTFSLRPPSEKRTPGYGSVKQLFLRAAQKHDRARGLPIGLLRGNTTTSTPEYATRYIVHIAKIRGIGEGGTRKGTMTLMSSSPEPINPITGNCIARGGLYEAFASSFPGCFSSVSIRVGPVERDCQRSSRFFQSHKLEFWNVVARTFARG